MDFERRLRDIRSRRAAEYVKLVQESTPGVSYESPAFPEKTGSLAASTVAVASIETQPPLPMLGVQSISPEGQTEPRDAIVDFIMTDGIDLGVASLASKGDDHIGSSIADDDHHQIAEADNDGDDDEDSDTNDTNKMTLPSSPASYFVLLPMVSMVRVLYQHELLNQKVALNTLLDSTTVDKATSAQLTRMLEVLKMLCDHQDLIENSANTQMAMDDDTRAKWAVNCSTKCLFLRDLLYALREQDLTVAILVRPGRMMDIIESMLKIAKYNYRRPTEARISENNFDLPLTVLLLPTGLESARIIVSSVDAVVAFDSTFYDNGEHYSKMLRTRINTTIPAPLISLVVVSSVEHLQLCLPRRVDKSALQRTLLLCLGVTRTHAGIIPASEPDIPTMAQSVADFIESCEDPEDDLIAWPLSQKSDLILDLPDENSPSEGVENHVQSEARETVVGQTQEERAEPIPGDRNKDIELTAEETSKRQPDDDLNEASSKRAKTEDSTRSNGKGAEKADTTIGLEPLEPPTPAKDAREMFFDKHRPTFLEAEYPGSIDEELEQMWQALSKADQSNYARLARKDKRRFRRQQEMWESQGGAAATQTQTGDSAAALVTQSDGDEVMKDEVELVATAETEAESVASAAARSMAIKVAEIREKDEQIELIQKQLEDKTATETNLRRLIRNQQFAYEDLTRSNATTGPKWVEAMSAARKAEKASTAAAAIVTTLNSTLATRATEISSLREVIATLTSNLATATADLAASPDASKATIAQLRATNSELTIDLATTAKRLANTQADAAYTTQQYHEASAAAANSVSAISALEASLALAQRELAAQRPVVAQRHRDEAIAQAAARATGLAATLAQREAQLRRREEELEQALARAGRRDTRATSMSRSPALRGTSPRPGVVGLGLGAREDGGVSGFGAGVGDWRVRMAR